MKKQSVIFGFVLFFTALSFSSQKSSKENTFSFLPESHFGSEFKTYFLQKNKFFKERYLFELNLHIDFALFSIKDRLFQKWEYHQMTSFGRQDEAVFMDPRDAWFHSAVYFEYRIEHFNIQAGLEHPCFHEIDRSINPVIYWNKLFLGLSSPHLHHVKSPLPDNYFQRLQWLVRWGYFVRSFGDVEKSAIFPDQLSYIHEFNFKCRYNAFAWKTLTGAIHGNTLLGGGENGAYWSQTVGGILEYNTGKLTGAFFVNYTLDDVYWTLSKDKLLEIGVRIHK